MECPQLLLGAPASFDLLNLLKNASSVTMAMAFAKRTGWEHLKASLLTGHKHIQIVVGLNFGITDIELLEEWLERSQKSPHFKVKIAKLSPTFHPKITLIRGGELDCALVGSGNLTVGGQVNNVECGAYIAAMEDLNRLEQWCASLKGKTLSQTIIDKYRPFHARTKRAGVQLIKPGNDLAAILSEGEQDWYHDLFLRDFNNFITSQHGVESTQRRVNAAKEIRTALRMPKLNFSKSDWETFQRIRAFGAIRLAYPEMTESLPELRKSLRALLVGRLDEETLRRIWNRREGLHVEGLGANQITKILATNNRQKWPVLNKRAWKVMLDYGYRIEWSALGYLQFAQDIRDCLKTLGKVDFWAFDAFCRANS